MEEKKLQIIGQLMQELQDLMGPGENDFSERLGREKPDMAVMKIEAGEPEGEEMMDEECDPDEGLKSRLMKLRG